MSSKRDAMTAKAISLIGCGYIYGATGWICTQQHIEQQAKQYPMYADLILKYGPKWMGKPCYDCAQLTRTVAKEAGVTMPSGASSQWRATGIWKEKGTIDTLPNEAGLFVFTMKNGSMSHTAVTIGNGETVDARGHAYGVVRRSLTGASYTHWARLAIDYDAPATDSNPDIGTTTRPTLRQGSSGDDVLALQKQLLALGYNLGSAGADGKYGAATKAAVMSLQSEYALAADGIVGPATWELLDSLQSGGDDEPALPTSICLSGALYSAFVSSMQGAQSSLLGRTMRLSMPKDSYDQIMALIEEEG